MDVFKSIMSDEDAQKAKAISDARLAYEKALLDSGIPENVIRNDGWKLSDMIKHIKQGVPC